VRWLSREASNGSQIICLQEFQLTELATRLGSVTCYYNPKDQIHGSVTFVHKDLVEKYTITQKVIVKGEIQAIMFRNDSTPFAIINAHISPHSNWDKSRDLKTIKDNGPTFSRVFLAGDLNYIMLETERICLKDGTP